MINSVINCAHFLIHQFKFMFWVSTTYRYVLVEKLFLLRTLIQKEACIYLGEEFAICNVRTSVTFNQTLQSSTGFLVVVKHADNSNSFDAYIVKYYLGLDARKSVFGGLQKTKAQTSLRIRAD